MMKMCKRGEGGDRGIKEDIVEKVLGEGKKGGRDGGRREVKGEF